MNEHYKIRFWSLMGHILGRPILASFIVGTAILSLNAVSIWYYEGVNYIEFLSHCYQINFLLFLSKIGPPYLIPLLVTTAAKHLERKNNTLKFMEDALPAIFVINIPLTELFTLPNRVPNRANLAYMVLFESTTTTGPKEPLLPERFWEDPSERKMYFDTLLQTGIVEGMETNFLTSTGNIWSGKIYSQCKKGQKYAKIQGMVLCT